jgi:anti-sigma B factor antagonist
MTFSERQIGEVTVVDVDGRVTIVEGADALRDGLQQLIDRGVSKLVLNCGKIPYVDTSGIRTIVRVYTSLHDKGGSLKLANLTPHVAQILNVTRLTSVLETYDDEAAAVNSFKNAGV